MGIHHGLPSSEPISHATHIHQPARWTLPVRLLPLKHPRKSAVYHRNRRIEYPSVLSQNVRSRQGVQANWTSVARFPLHEGLQERARTMVQRTVVRMVAHAGAVERDEHVDRGAGRRLVRGGAPPVCPPRHVPNRGLGRVGRRSQVGRERRGQEGRDTARKPGGGHAIWETGRVVDDEDVGFAAETEAHGALLELGFANLSETICVT